MDGGGAGRARAALRADADPVPHPDAARLVAALTGAGLTLAVAESLTGGSVVEAVVAVPGASACLRGGVVAYATDLKADLLDVPRELLERVGAVDPDVAGAMAAGVRSRLGADVGVATTGVAGPGPQDGHPAGTFHVAVDGPAGAQVVSVAPAPGGDPSRAQVRASARDAALALALEVVGGLGRPGDAP